MPNTLPILNKETLQDNPLKGDHSSSSYPERVLQIGEGNFLRGFIDWMIFEMNKAGEFQGQVVAIQPTPRGKVVPKLNRQDSLYTLIHRGIDQGKTIEKIEVINSISRGINPYSDWSDVLKVAESQEIEFVFSNTTEAGLQYSNELYEEEISPLSFPGKLVSLLYHRYNYYKGESGKGWIIIPCELVERNGEILKELCKKVTLNWNLPESFWKWVETECTFCNTLVDRIVTGYPHDEEQQLHDLLGYQDELMTVAEPFHLFVIDGPAHIQEKLPFKKAGLNVFFDDIESYRELKVKLLNAPHTILASIGLLNGIETVRQGIEELRPPSFIDNLMTMEISHTLKPEGKMRSAEYIKDVIDRFSNPFLHHKLQDISLNGFAKFRTRVMPCIIEYKRMEGIYPKRLVFSLAALIAFYRIVEQDELKNFGKGLNGLYEIKDAKEVLAKFSDFWSKFDGNFENTIVLVRELVINDLLTEEFLVEAEDLSIEVTKLLFEIKDFGIQKSLKNIDQ
jgi:tagaturonate reductase